MYKSKGEKNIRIQLVKDYFLSHKVASKNDLAQATHLSLATITNILKELQDIHYIERIDDCPSTGGRKAKRYTICAQYMLYGLISLQVIGQQIRVGLRVVNLDYSIIFNENLEYEIITKNQLIEIIQDLQKRFQLIYMSISIPAIVNDGHLTQCDIEGFENWHLLKELKNKVHAKIIIENDVNTAMLGYVYSQSIDKDPIAFIYQPDNRYSGCSLYINKTIVYGSTHFAGELGYLPLASLKEQEAILKVRPLELLLKQVASIIAIVNPTHMVLYAPCIIDQTEFNQQIHTYIPQQHQPIFEFIDSIDEYIYKGLMYQCIENSRYKTRRNENEC